MHKKSVQYFNDFLECRFCRSVLQAHPVGPGRVIPTTLVACLKPRFYSALIEKQERGCDIPNVLLTQLGGMEERCNLPRPLNDICWILGWKRLLMIAISRACSREHNRKFDERFGLRSFETYVYWRTISIDLFYVAPTRKQLVTDTTHGRIRHWVGSVLDVGLLD